MDDLSNKSDTDSENSLTIFEVRSSDEESTLENDRDDASIHSEATIPQQQRNIQPQIITTVSN
ncbi:hypothetical protein Tco_0402952, partial [Tanacetum coccineum]